MDNLWISIHDRARTAGGVSTALLNRIGQILFRAFDAIFGESFLSVRVLYTSTALSIAGALVTFALLNHYVHIFLDVADNFRLGLEGCAVIFCFVFSPLCKRPYQLLLFVAPGAIIGIYLIDVLRWWIIGSASNSSAPVAGMQAFVIAIALFIVSFMFDVIAIIAIRTLFRLIGAVPNISTILMAIMILTFWSILSELIPLSGFGWGYKYFQPKPWDMKSQIFVVSLYSIFLNIMTAVYCLLPVFALLFILLHRLAWPLLSRLLYPLSRFTLFTNRKALLAIGGLALTVAFNLEDVGLRKVLELIQK